MAISQSALVDRDEQELSRESAKQAADVLEEETLGADVQVAFRRTIRRAVTYGNHDTGELVQVGPHVSESKPAVYGSTDPAPVHISVFLFPRPLRVHDLP